jgi:glycosyl transferase, family 25
VRAYVINLARSPERRAHVSAELEKAGIDYEIVVAVDGRDLDMDDPRTLESIAPSMLHSSWFLPSHVAVAMSHLSVYRKILADGLDQALVLEDDVIVPGDLGRLADAVAEHLTGAEIALLNYGSEETCKMSREGSIKLPSSQMLVLPIDVYQPVSGAAYVITRKACERLDQSVLPVRAKCDNWAHHYTEGALDRVRCVVPLAVHKSPAFGSTIGYYSEESLKGRLVAMVTRYNIRLVQQAIAYRRRRIWRSWEGTEFVDMPFVNKPSRLE